MSSTNRSAPRLPGDAYYTPDALARACVALVPPEPNDGCVVLEPHAGGGAFVRALAERGDRPWALDIDPAAPGLAEAEKRGGEGLVGDFLREKWAVRITRIVGNPPFGTAEAHIRRALEVVDYGGYVGFVLRLAFLEGARRREFWREWAPESVHVLVERPSFTGGGTDSCAYMFAVWRKAPERLAPGGCRLRWLSWKGARG